MPTATTKLHGRAGELTVIDRQLAEARSVRSSALVIRGEAGIGKSTLLAHADRMAADLRVLRGSGIESETNLPFAGLHLLLRTVLDRVDELPGSHARALHRAFGASGDTEDSGGDRFAVGLAVLALFTELAKDTPVLVVIDDAHWLDRGSAEALLFAARRLPERGVAMLFAARDLYAPPFPAQGIEELRLTGLDAAAAGELLAEHADDLPPRLREDVAREARGNPLALLEIAAANREGRLGRQSPEAAPHNRVLHSFAERIAVLPETTRTMILVAAADGTCDTGTVLAAGELLGASLDDLRVAEDAQLLTFTDNCLVFRHPLMRTAAYRTVPMANRIRAHKALAEVLDSPDEVDRKAWHLAAASTGHDEDVAKALESSAEHARARGGYAAVATAYEQAAALSPLRDDRGRRLAAAARAAADAGQLDHARDLAYQATTQLTDPLQLGLAAMIHATLAEDDNNPLEAHYILSRAAERVAEREPELAGKLLFWAAGSASVGDDLSAVGRTAELAEKLGVAGSRRIRALVAVNGSKVAESIHALRELVSGESLSTDCVDHPLALRGRTTLASWYLLLGDDTAAGELAIGVTTDSRAGAAMGVLPKALAVLARTQLHLGKHREALASASEGMRIAEDIGQQQSSAELAGVLAELAAIEGDEAEVTRLASEAPEQAATTARTLLDLGLGKHDAVLDQLDHLGEFEGLHSLALVPDLVEAAVKARRPERAERQLARYITWAEQTGRPWARAVALRCKALLGDESLFEEAVRLHLAEQGRPFERARTELLYGEWLRRARRKEQARTQLRSALTIFERLGAKPWIERARTELRAAGRPADSGTAAPLSTDLERMLTPQELRIARLAAQGLTNRDIGTRMYLSPRTVGYHLYKTYPKLGISSRGELAKLGLAR
ncbi:AAA family ATPase [Saccharomonospora sp. NPDC006951]